MENNNELFETTLAKYYSKEEIQSKLNKIKYSLASDNIKGAYLIGMNYQFTKEKDHKALKELVKILNGNIENFFEEINAYEIDFKDNYLDKEKLNKIPSINYVML
jgi:hypothetical protein